MEIKKIHNPEEYYKKLQKLIEARSKESKRPRYIVLQGFNSFVVRRIVLKNKTVIESAIPKKEVLLCTK